MSEIPFSNARRFGPQKSAKSFNSLGLLGSRLDRRFQSAGADSEARVDPFPHFATKCYQTESEGNRKLLKMVDLVGIEPTTSSMPWKRAPSCATGPLCGGMTPDTSAPLLFSRSRTA